MFQYYNQRSKFLEKSVCGTLCATHTLFKEFTPLVIVLIIMEHAN